MPSTKKYILFFLILSGGAVIFFVLNLMFGSVIIPFREIWNVLSGNHTELSVYQTIFLKLRLPAAIAAVTAGAALSVSGLSMQTLFRNPLADPSILGISSGASLGVALVTLLAGNSFAALAGGNLGILMAAFMGAFLVLFIISILARKVGSTTLLLVGVMIAYTVGSVTNILQFFAPKEGLQTFIVWGMGSFKNSTMTQALLMFGVSVVFIVILFFQSKGLNAFVMGDEYAINSGIRVRQVLVTNVLLSGALVAVVTSFCGTIAFVGLMVPHFARMIFKTFDHRILVPAVALMGIVLMLLCDLLASLPGTETVLPVNAITSIIGAPVMIFLILKRKKQ